MDLFLNGSSIDDSTEAFTKLADLAFKPRQVSIPIISNILSRIPILSRIRLIPSICALLKAFRADSLYPAENIEAALQAVFGKEKTILDYSHATSIGTRVGLPVATIREPSSCIFTNYNGVGTRDPNQGTSPRIILFAKLISSRIPRNTAGGWLWESATLGNASNHSIFLPLP
jgi:hypothetical protein